LLSRAYPVRTVGTVLAFSSNPHAGTADFVAVTFPKLRRDKDRATLVRLPTPFNASRLTVTGARMKVTHTAGGRDVWLFPTGGTYRLTVTK
jgi:hypothetical protein